MRIQIKQCLHMSVGEEADRNLGTRLYIPIENYPICARENDIGIDFFVRLIKTREMWMIWKQCQILIQEYRGAPQISMNKCTCELASQQKVVPTLAVITRFFAFLHGFEIVGVALASTVDERFAFLSLRIVIKSRNSGPTRTTVWLKEAPTCLASATKCPVSAKRQEVLLSLPLQVLARSTWASFPLFKWHRDQALRFEN